MEMRVLPPAPWREISRRRSTHAIPIFMKSLLAFLLLVLATGSYGQAPATAPDEAAIQQLHERLAAAFNKGDLDAVVAELDPDVVVTLPNGDVTRGATALRELYQRATTTDRRDLRGIQCAPELLGHRIEGDWAVSWGNLHDRLLLTNGNEVPFNSVFTATLAKRGDRWAVASLHASLNAFTNPVLGASLKRTVLPLGLGSFIGGLVIGLLASRVFKKQGGEAGAAGAGA